MKKMLSLIKACMTDNMSLFKIKSKKQSKASKILLPIFLFIMVFFSVWSYANMIIEPLLKVNLEFVLLTLFIVFTAILTLVGGVYKSSSLIFNCKDDNLLLSLPIKKSTVLFIRVLKFYLYELLYNSLFLVPAMVVYIRYVSVNATFYWVSILAILLLPIIPIVISCIIGMITSHISSKFKLKNIAQTVISMLFILVIMYISFDIEGIIQKLGENATNVNELITKLYYPAGAYVKMITNFQIKDMLLFIVINIVLFTAMIITLSKVYYKINSNVKAVKIGTKKTDYTIKTKTPMKSLIKKEFSRFISSPVFIINAGFGMALFVVVCIGAVLKFDNTVDELIKQGLPLTIEQVKEYIPTIFFGFICISSLLTSITSSMISLEGKSFNILKSLPVKPFTIIKSKVLTAITIMIPFILFGDLIVFLKFKFSILQIMMILITSIILPLVSETIGILVNLKYPKMDAQNDTEVVKQSMSSMVAVLIGMGLTAITIYAIFKALSWGISNNMIILEGLSIYVVIYLVLLFYLKKKSEKYFNSITCN